MCRVLCVVGHLLLPLTFFFSFKQFSVGYVDKSYFVWGKKTRIHAVFKRQRPFGAMDSVERETMPHASL